MIFFSATNNKATILRWMYWAYDQLTPLHKRNFTRSWGVDLSGLVRRLKRQSVCLLVKTDEV